MRFLLVLLTAMTVGCRSLPEDRVPSAVVAKPVSREDQKLRLLCDRAKKLVKAVSAETSVVILVRGEAAHAIVLGPLTQGQIAAAGVGLTNLLSFDYRNVVVTVNNHVFDENARFRPQDGTISLR